jgi:formamidopyrimidine-DNA glycosylase
MPELPEVESLRRGLVPFTVGEKILKVEVLMPKLVSAKGTTRKSSESKTQQFISGLTGRTIKDIDRRAKNIIFKLDDGSIMLVHLKMTGQLVFKGHKPNEGKESVVWGGHPIVETDENELPNKHTYVIFTMENGTLYYNDVRQFGYLLYYPNQAEFDAEDHFKDLGLEPFSDEFTFENFKTQLQKHSGQLKKVFLDQKVVVGLGNIYADEVCFEAKILPMRTIKSLKESEIQALYNAIKRILPLAVKLGGSSVANYLLADGSRGNYAREHKVYGRAGKECLVCGTTLEKVQFAGRTTVYCPFCQK